MLKVWQKFKNLNPPVRWVISFVVMMLALAFIFAPEPRPVDRKKINFSTTSSSVMYFKNMRSYFYNIYEREKAPFVLYRLKRESRDTTRPHLQFMIIENRPAGEAYIYAEQNKALQQYDSVAVVLPASEDYRKEVIFSGNINNEGHFELAAKVYARLLNHEQIHLLNGKDTIRSLYSHSRERQNAETVLEDYFKLVNKN